MIERFDYLIISLRLKSKLSILTLYFSPLTIKNLSIPETNEKLIASILKSSSISLIKKSFSNSVEREKN